MPDANSSTPLRYDFFAPEKKPNSYPMLNQLRSEDAVHWSPQFGGWILTRHADVLSVLKDPRFAQANGTGRLDALPEKEREQLRPLRDAIRLWNLAESPEDHMRWQRMVKKYFTPATLEALPPRIQSLTNELIDAALPRGRMEVASELAYPMPAFVIAEMLGVPTKDRELLQHWSRDILPIFTGMGMEQFLQGQKSVMEMSDYMRPIIAERRREPRKDLISVLVEEEAAGNIRHEDEITANCVNLLFAGHETTANAICNGLGELLEHPEQLAMLREKPELMPSAVEEILRFTGIAGVIVRMPREPVELGGKRLEPNQLMFLCLGAANRDPEVFPDPDRFDITRKQNKHITFSYGAYYCLGASLARLEAQVCLSTVLSRLPNLRLEKREWLSVPPLATRSAALHVTF